MRRIPSLLAAAALALGLAACGDDDSSPIDDAADTGDTAVDDAPTDGGSGATGDDGDELPGDLGDLDPDELADLDIDLGDLEDFDGDLEEMMEGADDMISAMGGEGGGTVTVDGVTYEVRSDSCIAMGESFFLDGPGIGSDGTEAWVVVSRDISTREELEEFLDESMVDTMLPEGQDQLDEMYVEVHVGSTSRFEFADDQPSWNAMSEGGFAFSDAVVDFEVTGDGLRGSGQAEDMNQIETEFGETVPVEFDVACS